ncbi:MAG TPA: capsule biosynthesis protein, partial [Ruminococcaceae bacterium]|nr:capsule biosynthesis protein [Oscillospiraceae bacterium]
IRAADVAVVNQETVLAGRVLPPSNYPLFNSPTQVGDALVGAGFDVINHANNHILDMGEKGIRATLDYWDTKPVKVVGAYRSDADLENIRIVTAKGVRTAHIGVTEMTNGRYLPKNSQYRLIYAKDTALIQRLIKKAKSMADVVVVSVHWGTEDTYTLTQSQKTLAQQMVDWGADIIFGN